MVKQAKKRILTLLVIIGGFMAIGITGSIFENWEYEQPYTPDIFKQRISEAEEEATRINLGDLLEEDVFYFSTAQARPTRSFLNRPTACSKGTVTIDNSNRNNAIICEKTFSKIFGVSSSNIDNLLESVVNLGWQFENNTNFEYQQRNLSSAGNSTYRFTKESGIRLNLLISKKFDSYCDNRLFCDESYLKQWRYLATANISYRYQDF